MDTRIGNVEEKSDLTKAIHHIVHCERNMQDLNESLSVHDFPELKARAIEFIRRIREFGKLIQREIPEERRGEGPR